MDNTKAEAFAARLQHEMNAAMSCLTIQLGMRLGLTHALAELGPSSAAAVAQRAGCAERYAREWLGAMAVGGYISYDPAARTFELPREHAAVLLDPEHPSYAASTVAWLPRLAAALPLLEDAARSGGGVPYSAYFDGDITLHHTNRALFLHDYVQKWLPALPDLVDRLKAGGRVLDVGCGAGWSSISLARGFPAVAIDAIEPDAGSIAVARSNAAAAGVADRIVFHQRPLETVELARGFTLATAFECVHDMAFPVAALRRMRELLAPDGSALVIDEAVADRLEENMHFAGHLNYNWSILHCLPQALVEPGSAATGAVMGPETLRRYAAEAGFARMEIAPIEHQSWRFYRLWP